MAMPSSPHARRYYRVAKQRFDDALLLLEMGRTTAAVYLAGYSVECMLKALILLPVQCRRPRKKRSLGGFAVQERTIMNGCCISYVETVGPGCPRLSCHTLPVSNSWSTDMRYVAGTLGIHEAKAFLDAAVEIITWADGRL